jgi:hypothetical protein
MLAITRSEIPFKKQDSLIELRVKNLLFLKEIDRHGFVRRLSMLSGLLNNEERYYRVIRPGLIEINT